MSWDVILLHPQAMEREQPIPLGPAAQVRAAISAVHPAVDWSDPAWGTLDGDGWSIEFNAGDGDPIDSIMLHVRGGGDPLTAIAAICRATGWGALDMSTGALLDPAAPSPAGWDEFREFRDRIVAAVSDGTSLPRSGLRLEGTTLVRRDQRYDLAAAENLRFEPGTNWMSLILALLAFGAAVALKMFVPFAALSWILAGVLTLLGVLFLFGVRTDTLVFDADRRHVVCYLIGTPQEIAAFRRNAEAALQR